MAKADGMKNILEKGGVFYVRLWSSGVELRLGGFRKLLDAQAFRDKCLMEMAEYRFFPERYKKVGHIGGIPVVALRKHYYSQRKEFLEWQRMKLALERAKKELRALTLSSSLS